MKPRDFDDLIKTSEGITDDQVKKEIQEKIRDLQRATPLETDKWIYRSVVWALGLAALLCLFSPCGFIWRGLRKTPPPEMRSTFPTFFWPSPQQASEHWQVCLLLRRQKGTIRIECPGSSLPVMMQRIELPLMKKCIIRRISDTLTSFIAGKRSLNDGKGLRQLRSLVC